MSNPVPEGWEFRQLGDVYSVAIGGTPSRSNDTYWDGSKASTNRWVSIKDLKGKYIYETAEYISDEGVKNSNVKHVPRGTLMMSFKLTVGRTAFAGRDLYTNEAIAAFIPKQPDVDDQFVYQGLHHWDLLVNIDQAVKGVTLNKEKINQIEGLFPPLPEQQKIATILSSVDNVIESTQAQINKLQDLKTGMMQELLTQGIGHSEFKDSPVGRIPVGWEVDQLINLSINGINNGVFNDPKKVGSGYKLINVYDMYQGFGVDTNSVKLLELSDKEFGKNKVEYGDVFFTRSSLKLEGIAYCNINLSSDDDITYDGHLMRVRPDQERVLPKYLAYFCLSDHSRRYFMSAAKHSTMTTIGQADIAPLNVAIPPLYEQKKIVECIDAVGSSIRVKEKKRLQLQMVKKSLMGDLLTGNVRVKVSS